MDEKTFLNKQAHLLLSQAYIVLYLFDTGQISLCNFGTLKLFGETRVFPKADGCIALQFKRNHNLKQSKLTVATTVTKDIYLVYTLCHVIFDS